MVTFFSLFWWVGVANGHAATSFASPGLTYERDGWFSIVGQAGLGVFGGKAEFSSLFRQDFEEDRHPLLRERSAQQREDQRLGIALPDDRLAEGRRPVHPVRWGLVYSFARFAGQPSLADPEIEDQAHEAHLKVAWDALERIAVWTDIQFLLMPTDSVQGGALDLTIAYRHPFRSAAVPMVKPLLAENPRFVDDGSGPTVPAPAVPRIRRVDDEEPQAMHYPLEARLLFRINQTHQGEQGARSSVTQPVTTGTDYTSAAIGLGLAYRDQGPFTVGVDFRWYRTFSETFGLRERTALGALRQAYGVAQGQWLHALPRWEFESWMHFKAGQNFRFELNPRFAAVTAATAPEAFDLGMGGDLMMTYRWSRARHWDESFRGWSVTFGGSFGAVLAAQTQIAGAGSAGVAYSF